MSSQSFRRIKIDINDTLYSKIIRFGKSRCERCNLSRPYTLQCAHIIGRGKYCTRFTLSPKPNAFALCPDCHSWFDSHKSTDILFNEKLQRVWQRDSSYHWAAIKKGYGWDYLQKRYVRGQGVMNPSYTWQKKEITENLRNILKKLEEQTL